jgi:hypothetical protein
MNPSLDGLGQRSRDVPSELAHPDQHPIPALPRHLGVAIRRIPTGRGEDRRERRGLGQGQGRGVDAPVVLCCRLKSADRHIPGLPQVRRVQVHLQDAVLTEDPIDGDGEGHLPRLSTQRALARLAHRASDLHRERARSLRVATVAGVGASRPQQTDWIHAEVAAKALVLGRQDGRDQVARRLFERQMLAELRVGTDQDADQHGLQCERTRPSGVARGLLSFREASPAEHYGAVLRAIFSRSRRGARLHVPAGSRLSDPARARQIEGRRG